MSYLRSMAENAARAGKCILDYFTYTAVWNPLGALATVPVTIPISSDSDFLWMMTSGNDMTAINVFNPAPDMLIQYTDQGSGRNLQDNPVHWLNAVGNAQWPYVLPEPKLLIGNGGLQITLQDLANVAHGRVDLSIIGYKIFYIKSGYNRNSFLAGY